MGKVVSSGFPSIGELSVDWDYEPENPLGKRSNSRIREQELFSLLNVEVLKVQVATNKFNAQGSLVDLSRNGVAVCLSRIISVGTQIKFGMILGRQKLISKGLVRNVSGMKAGYRVGIEFVDMLEDNQRFIEALHSSVSYK